MSAVTKCQTPPSVIGFMVKHRPAKNARPVPNRVFLAITASVASQAWNHQRGQLVASRVNRDSPKRMPECINAAFARVKLIKVMETPNADWVVPKSIFVQGLGQCLLVCSVFFLLKAVIVLLPLPRRAGLEELYYCFSQFNRL